MEGSLARLRAEEGMGMTPESNESEKPLRSISKSDEKYRASEGGAVVMTVDGVTASFKTIGQFYGSVDGRPEKWLSVLENTKKDNGLKDNYLYDTGEHSQSGDGYYEATDMKILDQTTEAVELVD